MEIGKTFCERTDGRTDGRTVQLFLHSSRQKVSILYNTLSCKIAPSHGGIWTAIYDDSLGQSEPTIQTHHDRFSRFSQITAECPYFTMGRPFPPKLPLPMGGSGPSSNTWFPRPIRVLNPNDISIGLAVFAGLTSVTDRPTDHAIRSVTIDRIYVRSTGDAV